MCLIQIFILRYFVNKFVVIIMRVINLHAIVCEMKAITDEGFFFDVVDIFAVFSSLILLYFGIPADM